MIQAEDTSQDDEPLSTSPSWINNDVKQALGMRQRAYEIKRRINNEETVAEYIAGRREVKRIVKQEKRNKELSISKVCKHNSISFYSYINERRIVRNNIGPLITLDGIATDNDMANTMNSYSYGQYEGNIFDTLNFSTEEVQEKLQHLNIYKSTCQICFTLGFSMH